MGGSQRVWDLIPQEVRDEAGPIVTQRESCEEVITGALLVWCAREIVKLRAQLSAASPPRVLHLMSQCINRCEGCDAYLPPKTGEWWTDEELRWRTPPPGYVRCDARAAVTEQKAFR